MVDVDDRAQVIAARNFPSELSSIHIEIARDDRTIVLGDERLPREFFSMGERANRYCQAVDSVVTDGRDDCTVRGWSDSRTSEVSSCDSGSGETPTATAAGAHPKIL